MTTPRGSYGGGYGGYPSSASFPDTPIYDSLVAERGTPQIAPIRVPSAYTPYEPSGYPSFGGNLPALPPALPALPSGPSAHAAAPQPQPMQNAYPAPGYQQQPAPYVPQQVPRPAYNGYPGGYQNGAGYPAPTPQSPSGYQAARPVPPRPAQPRQMSSHPDEGYQRRNLGLGVPPAQQPGGYYQG